MRSLLATLPLLLSSGLALAQSAQGDVAVTIYNNNIALVQDGRTLTVPAGRSRQEFSDVSAQIRPETASLAGSGLAIVEQNFDYDLLSPDKLMEKAVGQTITIVRTNPATGAETREQAKVLAANGGIVLQIGNHIEVLRDDGLPVRVVFDKVPENLRARPTLSVTIDAAKAGAIPTRLSYLTPGLGWTSDYVMLFDEKTAAADMQGWVTLTNNTGTSYANARTLLVAGNVGGGQNRFRALQGRLDQAGTESGPRERLGDYYLYPLSERTTIANAQQKQVSFLDVKGAPARKTYEFVNGWLANNDDPRSAASVIKFSTGKQGGLGDQLPAGTIRVYMRDARGDPQFIGESRIDHTPMGSSLAISTGDAFDVKVRTVVVERKRLSDRRWQTAMRYTVTNARPEPVAVDVAQDGLWGDVRLVAQSIEGHRVSADRMEWKVPVPANGTAELTATFDTRN
ncbi:DUF4139 domain-containing protein [Sphingomonas histidinilytica]|uniref:DUF4139 domain-containing protein n=1 Tax=Rhizorhabdus histidinilytica TaxID=439228 RepID=UPI001ADC635D|nr:DUF4139 domain-containing protein [Rhizorhabdus histidinilytica]MBO9378904.1 DUF4139 domain-containing protein [Rhizorhabdus histidinilytica]